jgi:hypothetical protein
VVLRDDTQERRRSGDGHEKLIAGVAGQLVGSSGFQGEVKSQEEAKGKRRRGKRGDGWFI